MLQTQYQGNSAICQHLRVYIFIYLNTVKWLSFRSENSLNRRCKCFLVGKCLRKAYGHEACGSKYWCDIVKRGVPVVKTRNCVRVSLDAVCKNSIRYPWIDVSSAVIVCRNSKTLITSHMRPASNNTVQYAEDACKFIPIKSLVAKVVEGPQVLPCDQCRLHSTFTISSTSALLMIRVIYA